MTKMNNSKINNENKNNNKKENKIMKTNIGNKIEAALKTAGYTTVTFVAACAAEAEARRRAAAKALKKAAAIAAKKARDEERRAKDETRKAKAAARRTKKALASWKASVRAEILANVKADVKAGKAWEKAVTVTASAEEQLIKQTIGKIRALQRREKRALVRAEKRAHRHVTRAEARFKTSYDDRLLWFMSPEEADFIRRNNEIARTIYRQAKIDAETALATAQRKYEKIENMTKTVADPQRYQERCENISRLLKAGYTVICEHKQISSPDDIKELLSNWVIQNIDKSFRDGEAIIKAVALKEEYEKPADIYHFVGTTLEECKAIAIKNVKGGTAHWDSCPYTLLSTRDADLDIDNIVVDGETNVCPDCGKMSSIMNAQDEDGYNSVLSEYNKYFITEKGEYIGVLERSKCPTCEVEQKVASIEEANTVEQFVKASRMDAIAHCKNCGAELYALPYHFGPVTYEITLKEGQVFVHDVSSKELCLKCATEYYGGGLDGVKDDITVNHGLWAFRKGENNVHGALQRFKDFLALSDTVEFCATEVEQYCGDFGITIEHPDIKAAFDYTDSDAWSERDEEDSDKRYATRNLHAGIKDKATYDAAVKDHLRYGNVAHQYVELIVRMGKTSSITRMWVKEEFAAGHPHFFRALADIAKETSINLYVLGFDGNELWGAPESSDYTEWAQQCGLNSIVNSVKVEGETWGHFDLDEDRPLMRLYLFNLLVRRAERVAQKDRKATIVCGLPGSGKSTYINNYLDGYYTIDADVIKWLLPEYNGGDASHVHKESCKLASWLTQYLAVRGFNVAIPMIGDNGSLNIVVRTLKECGYDITAHFVDTDPEECARRCALRKRTMSVNAEKLQKQRQQIIENMTGLGLL